MRTNPHIQALTPYSYDHENVPVKLKLDWNEATLPPPAPVRRALKRAIDTGNLHQYGYPIQGALMRRLSNYSKTPVRGITVTAGSDDAHELICRTFLSPGDDVLIPQPSYSNFRVWPAAIGARTRTCSGTLQGILGAISRHTRLVYLINPYVRAFTPEEIARIARKVTDGIVLVDEAYAEYAGIRAAALLKAHPNIIITRSFSKAFRLAGLRIGYILSRASAKSAMSRIYNIKSVNSLAQVAAIESLHHLDEMHRYVRDAKRGMALATRELAKRGYLIEETPAGFFLLTHPHKKAQAIQHALARKGILVRGIGEAIRVTAAPPRLMRTFINAVPE